jgi:hypothetical protein
MERALNTYARYVMGDICVFTAVSNTAARTVMA